MEKVIERKDRIEEIDILRGIAAVLMILGHSFIGYPVDITNVPWCVTIQHFIYNFHMELFFVLAGVVYSCKDYKRFVKGKVKRILVPYVFFGILTLIVKAVAGAAINGVEPISQGVFKLIFRGGNYWFLYCLFLVSVIYPWIEKLSVKPWMEPVLAGVLLILQEVINFPSILLIDMVIYYLPFFILGKCIIREFLEKKKTENLRNSHGIIAVIVLLFLYAILDGMETNVIYGLMGVFKYTRAIAMILALLIFVMLVKKMNVHSQVISCCKQLFLDCGKYSLQLYLFNGYLLTIFRILICQILDITNPIIIVSGIVLGNLGVTLLACKYIIQKIPVLRDLCGIG